MISIVGSTLVSCAQGIPTKIQDAFNAKFPNAKFIKWDKENDSEWEAEFKVDGVEHSANFSENGTWKETEFEIKKNQLPPAVKETLERDFSGYEIESAEMTETPELIAYEVEIEKGEETMEVVIDGNGKVIRKKVKQEEDEDGDKEEKD